MAAPSESEVVSGESDYCEETDVFSANFDPLRALYDENIRLPFPQAEPFANMSRFVDHLNRQLDTGHCSRLPLDEPNRTASDTDKRDSAQANPTSDTKIMKRKKFQRERTVLDVMEDAKGPLSLLGWSKENKRKVKVCTRTFKGLRGICIGYVVAFDKFLNLALADVDEIYRKPPLGQTIYHQEVLTFSKIMEHFETRKKTGVMKKPEEVQKSKRNRKERKMRLEAKLKAEGVFIENYHPPPSDSSDPGMEGHKCRDTVSLTETSSQETSTNDEERITRLQELTENMLSSSGATVVESDFDKTVVEVSDITPWGSEVNPQSTKSSLKKKGKDVVKYEDFVWRHVRQIFLRGDNIVLIAVDKNR